MTVVRKRWRKYYSGVLGYLKTHKLVVTFIVIVLGLSFWAAYLRWVKGQGWAEWTGFSIYWDADGKFHPGKTLWDWLELFIVPVFLAIIAYFFNRSERANESEIATDGHRETALQTFVDKMTELLLNEETPLGNSEKDTQARVVARTRTLSTLSSLDPVRKGRVIQFLYEAKLVRGKEPIIPLFDADLSGVDLSGAFIRGINLESSNLERSNLGKTNMPEASLGGANLVEADMTWVYLAGSNLVLAKCKLANLHRASLMNADMRKIDLSGAKMTHARLNKADLRAAIMTEADMRRVELTGADLRWASLSRTNLSGAILRGAKFDMTNFEGANLTSADLTETDLSGAFLNGSNLTGAKVEHNQLSRCKKLVGTIMPDGKKFDPSIHTFVTL